MSRTRLTDPSGPLAFFAYTYLNAGGAQCTVQLVRGLRQVTGIEVIDVYGDCAGYMADLRSLGLVPTVLFPGYQGKTTIGDETSMGRLVQMGALLPHALHTAFRLRHVLQRIKPRAMWVDDEKALFVAWLALAGRSDLPLAYLVRTELPRIRTLCTLAWRRVDAAMGVSKDCLSYLRSSSAQRRCYARLAHGNLQVLYSGIDMQATQEKARPAPQDLPACDPHTLRIAFPAVLSPHKGHAVGIQAVARYIQSGGKAQLLLCGDIPPEVSLSHKERLIDLTRSLGVQEHVHLLGWRNDMLSIMARSDLVMLTSFVEGMPRSFLEAMALGRPILASRVSGNPELVRDGVDGLLVEPGNVEGFAQALGVLSDAGTRQRMGQSGQRRVREDFTPGQEIDLLMQIMDDIGQARWSKEKI